MNGGFCQASKMPPSELGCPPIREEGSQDSGYRGVAVPATNPAILYAKLRFSAISYPSIVAVKRLKREARPSGPLALVLAGSGRGQESLAVSNLPSIALTPVHLTAWTGSLTRTPAWGHVVRRCPDASRSTARERRSAATGLSPRFGAGR